MHKLSRAIGLALLACLFSMSCRTVKVQNYYSAAVGEESGLSKGSRIMMSMPRSNVLLPAISTDSLSSLTLRGSHVSEPSEVDTDNLFGRRVYNRLVLTLLRAGFVVIHADLDDFEELLSATLDARAQTTGEGEIRSYTYVPQEGQDYRDTEEYKKRKLEEEKEEQEYRKYFNELLNFYTLDFGFSGGVYEVKSVEIQRFICNSIDVFLYNMPSPLDADSELLAPSVAAQASFIGAEDCHIAVEKIVAELEKELNRDEQ